MKALILAAGRGKRLGDISKHQNKCMIEVGGKTLLERNLDCASLLNEINEIVIVVGYRSEDIINKYGNSYNGKRIKYVVQWEQKGLVDAICWSQKTIDGEDFMLMLGDELLIQPRHKDMIKLFSDEDLFGVCGVVPVSDTSLIKKTYTVKLESDGRISRLVEKPDHPFNNLMGTGNCVFRNGIFSFIEKTPINPIRGERELPDLIGAAVSDGKRIKSFEICGGYFNLNSPSEMDDISSYFGHF